MVKAISGQTERTRPNSRLQQQSLLETTPVLFRLPTIEIQPYQPADSNLMDARATTQETAPTLLRAYAASKQGSELDIRSGGAAANSSGEIAISPTNAALKSSEETRSWWEHWSSGVVMILLIIAMVVLGILAVRSNSLPVNSIASSEMESEFGDLDSITVPTPEITESTHSVDSAVPSPDEAELPVATNHVLAKELVDADVTQHSSPSTGFSGSTTANDSAVTMPTDLQLPLAQGSKDLMATATLMQPTPHDAPQQEYAKTPAIPSLGELNSASTSAAQSTTSVPAQPASSQLGQSPSLYDEATRQMQSAQSSGNVANLGSSMPNLVGSKSNATPSTTQVSAPLPTTNGTSATPTIRTTATPNSDEEEIIRAYLELTRSAQPSANPGTSNTLNRYQR